MKSEEEQTEIAQNEISIHGKLDHPNIVKTICHGYDGVLVKRGGQTSKNRCFMVMEYVKNGDLLMNFKNNGCLRESDAKYIVYQILDFISYIKSKNICHRDIKL